MQNRILIVEDNKSLAKLISKKIEKALDIIVDVAYSCSEAKLFLSRYQYFVTILDVNLPDAPDGEVVDFALLKKNRVLVLSGNIDKEFRQKMLTKDIIDYVNKSGVNDIDYIIYTIQRLRKNAQHKILVVDDSLVFRNKMKSMLENLFFNVITVSHGEEALGMLKTHPEISLVLTDYNMPVMNGLELTMEIRKNYSKNDLCILAISSNEDSEVNALFLKNGANDYIRKPFSKEEFSCRINNSIEALENIQTITRFANRDFLTGLCNRRHFFDKMDDYMSQIEDDGEKLALAMIDVDNFKKVNDTYGHEVGDKVLVALADILRSSKGSQDAVARFGGEEFCVVLKNVTKDEAVEAFERIRSEVERFRLHLNKENTLNFTISMGAVMFHEDESLQENINEADMLLYKAKNSGKNQLILE